MVGKQGRSERRSGGERGQGAEASGCVERPAKAEEGGVGSKRPRENHGSAIESSQKAKASPSGSKSSDQERTTSNHTKDASSDAGGAAGLRSVSVKKETEPPKRVLKNPSFLQEHRDRYGNHQRAFRGAKLDIPQGGGRPGTGRSGGSAGTREGGGGEQKDRKKFLHGNYDTYYNYRNAGCGNRDPRLEVLSHEWIEGKRVLDIGCNSGAITVDVARRMKPRHIMGVDIDPALIHKARINLRSLALSKDGEKLRGDAGHAGCGEAVGAAEGGGAVGKEPLQPPLSAVSYPSVEVRKARSLIALTGYEGMPDPETAPFEFPHNCSFRREDYVEESEYDCVYDTILCLSVMKWVHFNCGDDGVKRLFHKVFQSLAPGGCFVLEFQEWSSYKKKKSLTETFKRNCANIKLRPEMFQQYLVAEVGFTSVKELHITQPADQSQRGFVRPLLVFFK